MTIETLYDIRDRVWFMPMFSDIPVCGVVERIEIKIVGNSCSAVYSVSHNKVCYELASGDLYPTKEELIKSL